jgi:signal transduction histidine kinase
MPGWSKHWHWWTNSQLACRNYRWICGPRCWMTWACCLPWPGTFRYTRQTKVQVDFKYIGLERRVAPEIETAAYRIVQEALTNVARHADVGEVSVRLWLDQDALRVQIEDEGVGFDFEAALAAGITGGLSGMQERTTLLGGELRVESTPGAGTFLLAELPLRGTAARQIEGKQHG